jgi:hypothetical protein
MDGATNRELRQAAHKTAKLYKIPFTVEAEDIADWRYTGSLPRFSFPFLGDYVPQGWQRADRELMFVDNSGFGSPNEPATTQRRFLESLTPGKAYAIVEAGEFQVYIAEFERVTRKAA